MIPRFAAVDRVKAGGGPGGEGRTPAAGGVAGARVLDLDHLGAELAEDHPGIGGGDALADLDHDETGKRAWCSTSKLLSGATGVPPAAAARQQALDH